MNGFRRTAFGGSVELFLGTIIYLEQMVRKNGRPFLRGPEDFTNQPWLSHLSSAGHDQLAALKKLISPMIDAAQQGDLDMQGAAQKLTAHMRKLPIHPKADPDRKAHLQQEVNRAHYNAINVEHMGKPDGSARLELRDVAAQRNRQDLVQDLCVVEEQLTVVRDIVLSNHRKSRSS